MVEFRNSILFQYFMYILAKFNTFSRSWKQVSQFDTFNTAWKSCLPICEPISSFCLPSLVNTTHSTYVYPAWVHAAETDQSECWKPCSEDASSIKTSTKSKRMIMHILKLTLISVPNSCWLWRGWWQHESNTPMKGCDWTPPTRTQTSVQEYSGLNVSSRRPSTKYSRNTGLSVNYSWYQRKDLKGKYPVSEHTCLVWFLYQQTISLIMHIGASVLRYLLCLSNVVISVINTSSNQPLSVNVAALLFESPFALMIMKVNF